MEIKKLGFGLMRLPVIEGDAGKVDHEALCELVDAFLKKGFTYFDTSYVYHDGQSAIAAKKALVDHYPREAYLLANKLPTFLITEPSQIDAFFKEQLEQCGVDYFDYYLLHNITKPRYDGAITSCGMFEYVQKMKEEGHIKKLGFSFHDTAEELDRILTEHPEVDFVQIIINYRDWDSRAVQSRKCYEVIRRHGKQVIVMEPVKGGKLANIPEEAEKLLKECSPDMSISSWAIRYAASLDGVLTVLSGMSNMEQILDNTNYMEDFKPLNDDEQAVLQQVVDIMDSKAPIACTGCGECMSLCSAHISIPDCFACYNESVIDSFIYFHTDMHYYDDFGTFSKSVADCTGCHKCEEVCPQKLDIVAGLKEAAEYYATHSH